MAVESKKITNTAILLCNTEVSVVDRNRKLASSSGRGHVMALSGAGAGTSAPEF